MGAVYAAHDDALDRPVAIKLLAPGAGADPSLATRFADEAAAATRVKHPGLVPVLDAGLDPVHGPFLVFERLPGQTLRTRLAGAGPLPFGLLLEAVAQPLLGALGALHAAGIVHRDVKPENLLLGHDGSYRLGDLGLALFASRRARTATGIMLGTPGYLAPEILAGASASPASDLFAAALLLVEAGWGRLPWHAQTAPALMVEVARRPLEAGDLEAVGCPAAAARVLAQALASDPAARPRTPASLLRDLEALPPLPAPRPAGDPAARGAETRRLAVALTPSPAVTGPRRRPARPMLPWAVALVALGLGLGVAPRSPPGPTPPAPGPAPVDPLVGLARWLELAAAGPGVPDPAPARAELLHLVRQLPARGPDLFRRGLALFAAPGDPDPADANRAPEPDPDPDPDWIRRTRGWLEGLRAAGPPDPTGDEALVDFLLTAWSYALPGLAPEDRERLLADAGRRLEALPPARRLEPETRAREGLLVVAQVLALAEVLDFPGLDLLAGPVELFLRAPLLPPGCRELGRALLSTAARRIPPAPGEAPPGLAEALARWRSGELPAPFAPPTFEGYAPAVLADQRAAGEALVRMADLERSLDGGAVRMATALIARAEGEAQTGLDQTFAYADTARSLVWRARLMRAQRFDAASRASDDERLSRAWIWAFGPHAKTTWPLQDEAIDRLGPCFPPEACAERSLDALLSMARAVPELEPAQGRTLHLAFVGDFASFVGEIAAYRRSRLGEWRARIERELPPELKARTIALARLALEEDPEGAGFSLAAGALAEALAEIRSGTVPAEVVRLAWDACQVQAHDLWGKRRQRRDWRGAIADSHLVMAAIPEPVPARPLDASPNHLFAAAAIRAGIAACQLDSPELRETLRPALERVVRTHPDQGWRARAALLLAGTRLGPSDF